jgi:hypothetical protein
LYQQKSGNPALDGFGCDQPEFKNTARLIFFPAETRDESCNVKKPEIVVELKCKKSVTNENGVVGNLVKKN